MAMAAPGRSVGGIRSVVVPPRLLSMWVVTKWSMLTLMLWDESVAGHSQGGVTGRGGVVVDGASV